MNDTNIIASYLDQFSNLTINSDREMTIDSANITIKEFLNKADSSRVVLTTNSSQYTISIVDYMGARISLDVEEKKKTLLSSSTMSLNITIT